jgi:hypothetical protein
MYTDLWGMSNSKKDDLHTTFKIAHDPLCSQAGRDQRRGHACAGVSACAYKLQIVVT